MKNKTVKRNTNTKHFLCLNTGSLLGQSMFGFGIMGHSLDLGKGKKRYTERPHPMILDVVFSLQ